MAAESQTAGKEAVTDASDITDNPFFARLWTFLSSHETEEIQRLRTENLAGLSGRVLEVGAGTGTNFAYYPTTVTEVVAVEPEPYLRERAREAAEAVAVKVTVVDGVAGRLPLEDGAVDAGVASLVLCSVPDQGAALVELRRVIRAGGELRFYEHVVARTRGLARLQRALDRTVWPHVGGGCHCSRDTDAAIGAAGFEIESLRSFKFQPNPLVVPVSPHILGVARRP